MFAKTLGSTLIITGTAIGAGMLALPIVSGLIGFWPAEAILIVICALMMYTALLILEVTLACPAFKNNFHSMAQKTIGVWGQVIAWLCVCLLLYSLTCAYISGASSLIGSLLADFGLHIPGFVNALVFTIVFGSVVFCSTRAVDFFNRVLMSFKGISLIAALALLLPKIHLPLLQHHHIDSHAMLLAVPIFLTSFGFHTVIPSISNYLKQSVKHLRLAIIIGTLIPFLVYTLYLIAALGILPLKSFQHLAAHHDSVGQFVDSINHQAHSSVISFAIDFFSNVAMTTSFLGVTLGLFDFLADGLNRPNHRWGRSQTALLTFIPPLILAFVFPDGFVFFLGYAAIFVAILEVILPAWMSWKLRQKGDSNYRPQGGRFALSVVFILGLVLVAIELSQHF